jgi:branched-chain amino acid transport system permease protein
MLGGMITATVFVQVFALGEDPGLGSLVAALLVSVAAAMVGCALLNATIERIAYKPLRHAPRLAPLITAIGVSFILQNVAIIWKGTRPVSLPPSDFAEGRGGEIFTIGTCPDCFVYTVDRLFVLLITVPVLVWLVWLVRFTRRGKAMRATAQDKDAAAMMGIDVDRTISFTFIVAGALAGAAGVIFAFYATTVTFDTGFRLGLIAFTAAVLGGIGNLPGAVLGALLIGLIQAFNEGLPWHSPGSKWTESLVFAILILILVFRPEGLLGERTPEGG